VNGNEQNTNDTSRTWYRLRDEMTGEDKGFIGPDGTTRETDEGTEGKIREAFSRDLITMDNQVVDELAGVCFDGVCMIGPSDPEHASLVLKNLGALTGLRPEPTDEPGKEAGTPHPE
jgi:hypothetical protein